LHTEKIRETDFLTMAEQKVGETIPRSLETPPPSDDRVILKWLESQPNEAQAR